MIKTDNHAPHQSQETGQVLRYKKFRPLIKEQERCKEIPKLKRYENRPSLSELFQRKDKREKEEHETENRPPFDRALKVNIDIFIF